MRRKGGAKRRDGTGRQSLRRAMAIGVLRRARQWRFGVAFVGVGHEC